MDGFVKCRLPGSANDETPLGPTHILCDQPAVRHSTAAGGGVGGSAKPALHSIAAENR